MLHFGTNDTSSTHNYLKEEYLSKLTSPTSALLSARKYRGIKPNTKNSAQSGGSGGYILGNVPGASEPGPSTSHNTGTVPKRNNDFRPSAAESSTDKKVPKWFKTNK